MEVHKIQTLSLAPLHAHDRHNQHGRDYESKCLGPPSPDQLPPRLRATLTCKHFRTTQPRLDRPAHVPGLATAISTTGVSRHQVQRGTHSRGAAAGLETTGRASCGQSTNSAFLHALALLAAKLVEKSIAGRAFAQRHKSTPWNP